MLNRACRFGLGVLIHYRSLGHPTGSERLVFPHSMVRAARRWHVRAWCAARQDFRDFELGRIVLATPTPDEKTGTATLDLQWQHRVRLLVGAHPALTDPQAALLRDEYLGGAESAEFETREALVSYVVQDLRLATQPRTQLPPAYQLALLNAASFPSAFAMASDER